MNIEQLQKEILQIAEQAHMAGQYNAGVDPSYSEARVYCSGLSSIMEIIEQLQKENDELKAYIERLREALNNALTHCIDNDVNTDRFNQMISEALEETPSQSLSHIKAQVEEETIEICKEYWDELDNVPRKYKEQSNGGGE